MPIGGLIRVSCGAFVAVAVGVLIVDAVFEGVIGTVSVGGIRGFSTLALLGLILRWYGAVVTGLSESARPELEVEAWV